MLALHEREGLQTKKCEGIGLEKLSFKAPTMVN